MNSLGVWFNSRQWTPRQHQRVLTYLNKTPEEWQAMFEDNRRFTGNGDELYESLRAALALNAVDSSILRIMIDRNVAVFRVDTSKWVDVGLRPSAYHLIRQLNKLTGKDWDAIMEFIRQRLHGDAPCR